MYQSRRTFLKSSASVTAASLLPVLPLAQAVSVNKSTSPPIRPAPGFELLIMATNWGFDGTVDEFCKAAKAAGYDGVEIWWPANSEAKQKEIGDAVKKHDLQLGLACTSSVAAYDANLNEFKAAVASAASNSLHKPLYINCHTGKDYFTFEQGMAFMDYTIALTEKTGMPIYHETHRSRLLYSAIVTKNFMDRLPKLRLNLDISHWCVVHNSLLAEIKDIVDQAIDRADHIHARVGHAEGAQVNDPRAPEWASALNAHLQWWDRIIARKKSRGERMTILTEFGPPDYMPTLPYTRQPVADQWAINVHMMNLLRERYLAH
ncbi:TIM barrel protein [Mucilaginibacter sp. SP1R1]|uniref:TIM barrel protein n=1 Tax=Mucilaginibacter sp. SP1R1 TaxID=2723091 RepID=UPI00161D6A80